MFSAAQASFCGKVSTTYQRVYLWRFATMAGGILRLRPFGSATRCNTFTMVILCVILTLYVVIPSLFHFWNRLRINRPRRLPAGPSNIRSAHNEERSPLRPAGLMNFQLEPSADAEKLIDQHIPKIPALPPRTAPSNAGKSSARWYEFHIKVRRLRRANP